MNAAYPNYPRNPPCRKCGRHVVKVETIDGKMELVFSGSQNAAFGMYIVDERRLAFERSIAFNQKRPKPLRADEWPAEPHACAQGGGK